MAAPETLRGSIRHAILHGVDALSRRYGWDRTTVMLQGGTLAFPDYSYRPHPRFGLSRPALPWLVARLEQQSDRFVEAMDACAAFAEDLARIPLVAPEDSPEPHWHNVWMTGLDAAWLYGVARLRRPKLFLEIGSGNSTKFVRRGIRDGRLDTRIISIDPQPRAGIDSLCDAVHRMPLEEVELSVFDDLHPGDVLFFDGSHRAFQNSDVTVFFLEVLPRVRPGVLVGVHDIFLPWDYPADWTERLYNEQHMLAAYLLGRSDLPIEFAANWLCRTATFAERIERLFAFDATGELSRHQGGCFFFRA